MSEYLNTHFNTLVFIWILIGITVFIVLTTTKIRAPYGRHAIGNWGPEISNKLGWFIMELPALIILPFMVYFSERETSSFIILLVVLWGVHYFNRTVIFPLRIRTSGKSMPLLIVASAIFFNLVNGFLNGYYLGYIIEGKGVNIFGAHVIFGIILFVLGMAINQISDSKLIQLRKTSVNYKIPRGWLFEYISCPNHFGEIVEWGGYAIIAWNLPALSFALWTFFNLVPRALNHHQWYKENFEDYPNDRKAVIPRIL